MEEERNPGAAMAWEPGSARMRTAHSQLTRARGRYGRMSMRRSAISRVGGGVARPGGMSCVVGVSFIAACVLLTASPQVAADQPSGAQPSLPADPGRFGMAVSRHPVDAGDPMTQHAVRVCGVDPAGAAARVGVRVGDTIVTIDGQPFRPVGDEATLLSLGSHPPGKPVTITLDRGGAEIVVQVVPERMSPEQLKAWHATLEHARRVDQRSREQHPTATPAPGAGSNQK